MSSPSTDSADGVPSQASPRVTQTLSGFRIGVTADRRSAELISAFERRGAEVMHAPAMRIAPLTESLSLQEDTRAVISAEPDYLVVTTAYGMRRWAEAADAYGLGEELHAILGAASILVRSAKARGAVRATGLDDDGAAADERTSTVVDMLLEKGVSGKTVAFQLHGTPNPEQITRLQRHGAQVVTVMPYAWTKPTEDSELLRMINAVIARQIDMVTFTAAPAVEAFLGVAGQYDRLEALIEALTNDVGSAVVGGVTAAPLREIGVEPIIPHRWRLGAMIRRVCQHLEERRTLSIQTRHGSMEIRGAQVRLAEVCGDPVHLAPGLLSLLRALVRAEGAVIPREVLVEELGSCESAHALEMLVSRLRRALPVSGLIQTVVKRGYRLAV